MEADPTKRSSWTDLKDATPRSRSSDAAYEDGARIAAFRDLVYRLRTEAGLTQADLAEQMGTTQSAIARMEGGGSRPTFDTLERHHTSRIALRTVSADASCPLVSTRRPSVILLIVPLSRDIRGPNVQPCRLASGAEAPVSPSGP